MTTQDLLEHLKLVEIFKSKSIVKNNSSKNVDLKVNYNLDKSEAELFVVIENEYGWDEPHNAFGFFGKLYKINDDLFYFSRFIYQSLVKKPQGGGLLYDDELSKALYTTVVINDITFTLTVIGNNYIYSSKKLEEDQQIKLTEFETLVRVFCTKKGSVMVPSKTASRHFIVVEGGFLLVEHVTKPIRFKTNEWGKTLDSNDILILASSKNKTAKSKEEIRKVYLDGITNALLDIKK